MIVERKIKIDNKKYLIGIELYYENKKVCKKSDKFNKYFDFGDLSCLIDNTEKNYKNYTYDEEISFINNIIYIYDNIPFVTYIKEVTELDTLIIKREEIELYIKENNIKLKNHYLKSITPLFFNK